jgi:DNA-binding MarR family transcriptional regulator
MRDRAAEDLLALIPFYHKHIIKTGFGITGLQAAQYRVLGVLMKAGTLPMSEIGRRLYISKPYMTALIDTLIEREFVERRPGLTDRRVINITITEQGKRHLKQSLQKSRETDHGPTTAKHICWQFPRTNNAKIRWTRCSPRCNTSMFYTIGAKYNTDRTPHQSFPRKEPYRDRGR